MKGIIPNQLEIMDNGILTVPFYECVNNVCKENGVEISSFTFMLEAYPLRVKCFSYHIRMCGEWKCEVCILC